METKLHLIAREAGSYDACRPTTAAPASRACASRPSPRRTRLRDWIARIRATNNPLTPQAYADLAKPSERTPVTLYSTAPTGMFDFIMHNQMSKLAGVDPFNCTPATKNLIATAE